MIAKTIGLVIPSETHLFSQWEYNYYFTEILRGAIAAASLFEWDIIIHHRCQDSNDDYIDFWKNQNIAGLVYLAPLLNNESLEQIKEMNFAVIMINSRVSEVSYVDTDNTYGAKKAAEYLLELGHRRIAIINGDMSTTNAQDRFEGYKAAFLKAGEEIDDDLVKEGKFSEDSGSFAMGNILSGEKQPTAVLCANDLIAIGAIRAIKEKGLKIPEDISIIGFDDLIISSYLTPPLTTVRQPLFHLGKEAVVTLMSMIRGEKENYQEIEIETRLIKRESAGPPKN